MILIRYVDIKPRINRGFMEASNEIGINLIQSSFLLVFPICNLCLLVGANALFPQKNTTHRPYIL